MTEKKGHFEKGLWVEEPEAPQKNEDQIDARIAAATSSVISAMDDAAKVARDLMTTEEGKKHIEKTMKDTSAQIKKSFEDVISRAKSEMDKTIKSMK
jgi:septal ring factor EnvC (AmiA/AmiB activator)